MKISTGYIIGFLLFIFGVLSFILNMLGLQLKVLDWVLNYFGEGIGLIFRIFMIFGGIVIILLSKMDVKNSGY